MFQAIPISCTIVMSPSQYKTDAYTSVTSMTSLSPAECYCNATKLADSVVSHCRAIDYSSFGPLVFPLLKLFFRPHPFGGQRRLLDTTPSEANAVARHTGLQLYKDDLFFSLDAVQVTPEECQQLLRQLHALVDTIVQESAHPVDQYGQFSLTHLSGTRARHLPHNQWPACCMEFETTECCS